MFGSRLKELRRRSKISQKELAEKLFVSAQAVGKWERDEATPNPDTVLKIAQIFEVSTDHLLGSSPKEKAETCLIPVLGYIPAGIPLEAIENIMDWEEIPQSMCRGDRDYFGLVVRGDSMYPEYLEGDTVIVRKSSSFDSGDVCIVFVNGDDATLKQVKRGEDGGIAIIPFNRSYPPHTFSREEVLSLPITIAGVVVELRRKVKK